MVGFSRFGQIAAQILLAGGRDVTVIDDSADRVRQAALFGFRIYFGDGTRKEVLLASGIEKAKIVAVLTQKREVTDKIVDLIRPEFPNVRLFVRSYDRIHTISLRARGVDYELRETLESGLLFGRKALEALGISGAEAEAIGEDIRKRDEERLLIQAADGLTAGRHMLHNRPVKPEPLTKPKHAPCPSRKPQQPRKPQASLLPPGRSRPRRASGHLSRSRSAAGSPRPCGSRARGTG